MSHYTTEVRYICEQAAGLTSSVGADQVDSVIAKSWQKIFGDFPIYDESYRSTLCSKILRHYYLREIGCETVGIWKMWLTTRMREIMPYYNKLYKAALLEYNILTDTDYTRTGNRDSVGTDNLVGKENIVGVENVKGTSKDDRTSTQNRENDVNTEAAMKNFRSTSDTDIYSDTPQGGLEGVLQNNYLTNARRIDGHVDDDGSETRDVKETGTTSQVDDYTGATSSDKNTTSDKDTTTNRDMTSKEDYGEHIVGKMPGKTYGELLEAYRQSVWNIDIMIIEDLKDLFMGLW